MTQELYRSCMAKGMGGGALKGLSKEDRRIRFCVIAKGCSKKMSVEEATRICSLPKEPKPRKARAGKGQGKSCEKESLDTTNCMMDYFETNDIYKKLLNINTVGAEIANALLECKCKS